MRKSAKILQIGNYPPPMCGWAIQLKLVTEELRRRGHICEVLKINEGREHKSRDYVDVQSGFDYALSQIRFTAGYGAEFQHESTTFSFALPRTRFDTILCDAAEARGAEVREHVKVEELVYEGGAVAGVVARESGTGKRESIRARVVVGADGLRSVVARR